MNATVCALLSWYEESPLWLAATVASLAGDVDHLVAVDGAYALFPKARARSHVEQHVALVEAASAARIGLTLHAPDRPWVGNEVEKRNAAVKLGMASGCDWLLVVDADMVVTRSSGGLRAALADTDLDVAQVAVTHRDDPQANVATARAARDGLWQRESVQPYRLLYRADESLRYEGAHYVIRNDHGYLWGNESVHELLPAADVTLEILFDHRSRLRDVERRQLQQAYYRLRDQTAAEVLA